MTPITPSPPAQSAALASDTVPPVSRDSLIEWLDIESVTQSAIASPSLLDKELYRALAFRKGNHYPRQKNYHGFYYFAQTGHHVWHESLVEASVLSFLDLHEEIVAISSQPMKIIFPNGKVHYPDFLALHADQRQVVYDVKPSSRMTEEVVAQFKLTAAVCAQVGWDYQVQSDLPKQVMINISWIGAFRHHGYNPGLAATTQLLSAMGAGFTLGDAVHAIGIPSLPQARSAVYHLIATRLLRIDLTQPLSDSTFVNRTPRAHA